jgi:hypothetical protein
MSPALRRTASALGAWTRNVILLSADTSGDTTRGPVTLAVRLVFVACPYAGPEKVSVPKTATSPMREK